MSYFLRFSNILQNGYQSVRSVLQVYHILLFGHHVTPTTEKTTTLSLIDPSRAKNVWPNTPKLIEAGTSKLQAILYR